MLEDCDVVISCVSLFTEYGAPVVEAAIAAGVSYTDTSGEQRWIRRIYDEFSSRASEAGVSLLPAATDDGVPGDLIAGLVVERLGEVETVRIHHGLFDAGMSRGSMASFRELASTSPLAWQNGEWRETDAGPREAVEFPVDGEQPSWAIPGPEVVSIQRHVTANTIESTMNIDLVAGVSSFTDEVIAAAPFGPSDDERRATRFTILAQASAPDGATARGYVSGPDAYNSTAIIAIEAALRLAERRAPVGAVPASLAFQPAEFLNSLEPFGITWQVDA